MNSLHCVTREVLWTGPGHMGTKSWRETNHLGLKLVLGLLYPSVRLSLEAPGLPLSTSERSTSGVKPNLDTWCVPAEFALCLQRGSLCVSRMKKGLLYKKGKPWRSATVCCFFYRWFCLLVFQNKPKIILRLLLIFPIFHAGSLKNSCSSKLGQRKTNK